jgi:hypothetical protein
MSPETDKRIPAALLVLRFFLAIFLLQWSIEKLILPNAAASIARNFYGITLPVQASYALGMRDRYVIQWDKRRPMPSYAENFCAALAAYMREVLPITRPSPGVASRRTR